MYERMVLGFGKQQKKATPLASRKAELLKQRDGQIPQMRSPVLDSAPKKRSQRSQRGGARRSANRARFAVEDAVSFARPAAPRKRLPRGNGSVSEVRFNESVVVPKSPRTRSGITAGWKLQALWEPELQDASQQVISEEKQKKLAALDLEMRMPRIAGKIDAWLLISVLVLLCIGLVMVYSASSFIAARDYGDAAYFFQRQLLSVILGVIVLFVTMRIDYRQWRRFSLVGLLLTLPLLVYVLKYGRAEYGASRWIAFGSFLSFQPSELVKLVLALYIADWLARKGNQVSTFLYGLVPFVVLVGAILGLVLLENDMGTAVIIAGLATVMFFTAGANIIQFLLAMACGGLIFLTEALQGYRYLRIVGFLNPFKDITGINMQLYQSLLALGSGGWLGVGLGASRQKAGYLPFPFIDSIFAITGEELGFIGCAFIVLLFLFLAFRGFRLARRSQDIYGALLATGITTWLVLQAVINIGSTTGTIPYTGVPLPFISFGGSSLVISLAAIGVLLNISRYSQAPENLAPARRSISVNMRKKQMI